MMRAGRDYGTRIMKPARRHIVCSVTTCPNGKCRATGECIERRALAVVKSKTVRKKP